MTKTEKPAEQHQEDQVIRIEAVFMGTVHSRTYRLRPLKR